MKTLGLAVAAYYEDKGHYPPAYIADQNGNPMHSWRVLLLPYIDGQQIYDRYDFSKPWNSEENLKLAHPIPAVYVFHSDEESMSVLTNYLAVVGENTAWPNASKRKKEEITDDLSSTILIAENQGAKVHWMEPRDLNVDSMKFKINDPKGISSKYVVPAVLMFDDSLRQLAKDVPKDVLSAMLTVNGGEELEATGDTWRFLKDGRLRLEEQKIQAAEKSEEETKSASGSGSKSH